MTKDELEMTLNEIKTHREILLSALNELKKPNLTPKIQKKLMRTLKNRKKTRINEI